MFKMLSIHITRRFRFNNFSLNSLLDGLNRFYAPCNLVKFLVLSSRLYSLINHTNKVPGVLIRGPFTQGEIQLMKICKWTIFQITTNINPNDIQLSLACQWSAKNSYFPNQNSPPSKVETK